MAGNFDIFAGAGIAAHLQRMVQRGWSGPRQHDRLNQSASILCFLPSLLSLHGSGLLLLLLLLLLCYYYHYCCCYYYCCCDDDDYYYNYCCDFGCDSDYEYHYDYDCY